MLTEKELQVLLLRSQSLLQTEIAARLKITQGAVSRFEANAKAKIKAAVSDLELLKELGIEHGQTPIGVADRQEQLQRWLK